ncbi:MAG TPA: hypothetical protein VF432_26945 [Thermoanaerobaculia bacterium]
MSANSRSLVSVIVAVFLAAPMTAERHAERIARPDGIPSVIASARKGVEYPVWVAAEAAIDANGDFQPSLLSPTNRSILDDNRQLNAGATECRIFVGTPHDSYSVSRTFDDAIGNALTIVSGEVVAVQQGFYTGLPGTLAAVRIAERLKTFGRADSAGDVVYVFVQEARIATPKGLICASTFEALPPLTRGDRVIVLADLDPIDQDGQVLDVDPQKGLVVAKGDTLLMPKAFGASSAATLDDLLSKVRSHPQLHTVKHEKR